MNIDVNYLAVLLAAISSMIVGFLWYSPLLFGKPWIKLMGYTDESLRSAQNKMGIYYGLSFILSLITAYILACIIGFSMGFFNDSKLAGLVIAFAMWLGFVMPVQATATIFSLDKKWKLFAINTGYQLAVLLLMGIILVLL